MQRVIFTTAPVFPTYESFMNPTTIALVDDHKLLRAGLASLINSMDGFHVLFEADNGKDFINQAATMPKPDVVLLDITMPEMNGYQTASWIKENLDDTKVLTLSVTRDETAVIRMIRVGARGYLLKDSTPATFKAALTQVCEEGFYFNELVSPKLLYNAHSKKNDDLLPNITERELTFLQYACTELNHREIAKKMCISPRTVDSYRDALFAKLNITTRTGLVLYAIKTGLVVID